jgi:hypothetical protein
MRLQDTALPAWRQRGQSGVTEEKSLVQISMD